MDITASLQNLGLTEKEAKVYTSLLQLGKTTAYSVAVRSSLKNPTVYVTLENLIDKGIVQKIPRAKKALYTAISPEDLFSIAKAKLKNAEEVLPELKALSKKKEFKKIGVSYYEGLPGIKEMYSKLLKDIKGKEFVAFFAHAADASPELLKYFDELNEEHRKLDTKRRGITVHHPTIVDTKYFDDNWIKGHNTKIKTLPVEKYNSNISIEVYKNKVVIFSHRYLQATVIDNPDVANVMRQIFELVWERNDIVVASKG